MLGFKDYKDNVYAYAHFLESLVLFAVPVCHPSRQSFTIGDHGKATFLIPKNLCHRATCSTHELTVSSTTCAMKVCAQEIVNLEGKLTGRLSRQNANSGDPWTSLPLSFRTADFWSHCLEALQRAVIVKH